MRSTAHVVMTLAPPAFMVEVGFPQPEFACLVLEKHSAAP